MTTLVNKLYFPSNDKSNDKKQLKTHNKKPTPIKVQFKYNNYNYNSDTNTNNKLYSQQYKTNQTLKYINKIQKSNYSQSPFRRDQNKYCISSYADWLNESRINSNRYDEFNISKTNKTNVTDYIDLMNKRRDTLMQIEKQKQLINDNKKKNFISLLKNNFKDCNNNYNSNNYYTNNSTYNQYMNINNNNINNNINNNFSSSCLYYTDEGFYGYKKYNENEIIDVRCRIHGYYNQKFHDDKIEKAKKAIEEMKRNFYNRKYNPTKFEQKIHKKSQSNVVKNKENVRYLIDKFSANNNYIKDYRIKHLNDNVNHENSYNHKYIKDSIKSKIKMYQNNTNTYNKIKTNNNNKVNECENEKIEKKTNNYFNKKVNVNNNKNNIVEKRESDVKKFIVFAETLNNKNNKIQNGLKDIDKDLNNNMDKNNQIEEEKNEVKNDNLIVKTNNINNKMVDNKINYVNQDLENCKDTNDISSNNNTQSLFLKNIENMSKNTKINNYADLKLDTEKKAFLEEKLKALKKIIT